MAFKITTLSVFLLIVHLCSIQNVFGQCLREFPALGNGLSNPNPYLGAGLASPVLGADLALSGLGNGLASCGLGANLASAGLYGLGGLATSVVGLGANLLAPDSAYDISFGAYGGSGVGNLNVFGELPVGGSTLVSGQVPILGSVQFGGPLPAAGSVTISGSCNCGCNNGY